jgi:hypothetical protein
MMSCVVTGVSLGLLIGGDNVTASPVVRQAPRFQMARAACGGRRRPAVI